MAKLKQITPETDWNESAELAYLAYFASKNGEQAAQPFGELMDSTKQAWIAVAMKVVASLTVNQAAKHKDEADLEPADAW
jgi:hypothetical protein